MIRSALLAGVAGLALVVSGTGTLAQEQPQGQPQAGRPPAAATQAPPAWPRTIEVDRASVTVYQPQAIAWPDRRQLRARVAVAITPTGATDPVLGTLELTFATQVDTAAGTVTLSDAQLNASRFPMADTAQAGAIEAHARAALGATETRTIPIDTILLALKETQEATPVAVNNDPPVIFYSARPASLVVFDGEPVLAPIGDIGLGFAVNTNWPVFSDGKAWFLLNGTTWFSAPQASGPWQPTTRLPPAFSRLPADPNFAEVRKAVPAQPGQGTPPTILVSTKPAEIIVTQGPPQFVPVPGTSLQAVKNAGSALFFEPATGTFFYLTSGRWFSATGLNGPWRFATDRLPPDFAFIDPNGNYGAVLPSVPKTAQAQAAVLKAQLPQQGTLKREGTTVSVTYVGGEPRFEAVPGTQVRYATNTSFQVLEIGGRFYLCHQGAWFVAATPTGPWALADSVPHDVYTIPPASPVYPVTYVTVQSSNPSSVTYAYTAGYLMGFITAGVLVYGTGYYYPPYVYPGRVPVYMPRPYSYAGGVYYNPTSGAWARGGAVYGPYYGARGGAAYNPQTGAWARGGAVYGPYGGAGAWSAYNPQTGSYARGAASWNAYGGTATASAYNAQTGRAVSTTQNTNMYQRWGSSTISTPSQTINTQSASGPRGSAGAFQSSTGAAGAGVNTARGGTGAVKTSSGDVYAGHDGNVYRHTDNGWQTYNNGGWQSVQKPTLQAGGSAAASTAQANRTTTPRTRPTEAAPANRPTMSQSSFRQLEQDRMARFSERAGAGNRPAFGGGGGGAPAGGRFEGRAAEGGRFHR